MNTLVVNNSAKYGGGVYCYGATDKAGSFQTARSRTIAQRLPVPVCISKPPTARLKCATRLSRSILARRTCIRNLLVARLRRSIRCRRIPPGQAVKIISSSRVPSRSLPTFRPATSRSPQARRRSTKVRPPALYQLSIYRAARVSSAAKSISAPTNVRRTHRTRLSTKRSPNSLSTNLKHSNRI